MREMELKRTLAEIELALVTASAAETPTLQWMAENIRAQLAELDKDPHKKAA